MRTLRLVLVFSTLLLHGALFAQSPFPNVMVDNSAEDGECTVVINPQDPLNLLAATNPDIGYRSSDGGQTWTRFNLSAFSTYPLIGDVALAADNSGNFYFQVIDQYMYFRQLRSSDYGVTWNTESVFGDWGWTEDKNWMTVDRASASPYQGRLYCAWTRRTNGSDPGYIFVNHSPDSGQSWAPRDTLDADTSAVPPIGTGLAVGPAGEIGVSWGGGFPNEIHFKKSLDGGNTWPGAPVIVDNSVQPVNNYYTHITHPIHFSAQFTSLACDISGGPHNGNYYCVWDDVRNGTNNADIFLARSTDGGQTWATQRINDDMGTHNQVVPTVAVDPGSGWVFVSYLDARLNTDTIDDTLHYYLAWSSDGGQTFQNVQVSQQASTVTGIHSDYMGMDAYGGKVHLFWVGGQTNAHAWTCAVSQPALTALEEEKPPPPPLQLFPAAPNPAIDFTAFDFELGEAAPVTIHVTDLNGRSLLTPVKEKKYGTGRHQFQLDHAEYNLAPGMYVATITTPYGKRSRKFTVMK